ncbi:MAG: hypothetical protein MK108_03465 [Mariniblastus sp.]|nr:hypothetical protein [Mariniblastus sp.]
MFDREQIEELQPAVRTVQTIALFLILGAVSFLAFCLFITDWQLVHTRFSALPTVSLVSGIVSVMAAVLLSNLIGRHALQFARQRMEELGTSATEMLGMRILVGVIQTEVVVRYAVIDSALFFGLIVFVLDGSLVSLAGVIGLLLVMIVTFPRTSLVLETVNRMARRV